MDLYIFFLKYITFKKSLRFEKMNDYKYNQNLKNRFITKITFLFCTKTKRATKFEFNDFYEICNTKRNT